MQDEIFKTILTVFSTLITTVRNRIKLKNLLPLKILLGNILDLPTRPFYPAISGNLKQLPVAVYFKQLPNVFAQKQCGNFSPTS
jgi:hypothetical protein